MPFGKTAEWALENNAKYLDWRDGSGKHRVRPRRMSRGSQRSAGRRTQVGVFTGRRSARAGGRAQTHLRTCVRACPPNRNRNRTRLHLSKRQSNPTRSLALDYFVEVRVLVIPFHDHGTKLFFPCFAGRFHNAIGINGSTVHFENRS